MEKTVWTKKNKCRHHSMFFLFISFSVFGMMTSSRCQKGLRPDTTDKILLNEQDDNTVFLKRVDEDGFIIGELANPDRCVYVYFSERERFIDCLRGV